MNNKIVLGVTGTYGAGKDTVANYLIDTKKFIHYSLSDILRDEAKLIGVEQTRDNWIKLGNEIRIKYGNGELAKRLIKKIEENNEELVVVTSIRNPGEIDVFRELSENFYLIAIDAPIELRYQRASSRGNLADNVSFEKFKKMEKSEMAKGGFGQQIGICVSMADYIIVNDKGFDKINIQLEKILKQINL